MRFLALFLCLLIVEPIMAAPAPIYLWYEPEWFDGVKGSFGYWTGEAKPTGHWGVAGPGISPEWTQGGESEWNSMGAPAAETRAVCRRSIVIPRTGSYRLWVRYVDHRNKTEPFKVRLRQGDKVLLEETLGTSPIVPPNDEYQLYWGFSFGWASIPAKTLPEGPAQLELVIDQPGEAWRQVDVVCLTDDMAWTPVGREKPRFGYLNGFSVESPETLGWRGSGKGTTRLPDRKILAGRPFTMWTGIDTDPKWWAAHDPDRLSLYDLLFQFGPATDIREAFRKEFAGRTELPLLKWKGYVPGLYLGNTPDLLPGTALRKWLERTKSPFYIMTNYANPTYTEKTGPATFATLQGPLASQFLGYIHGEAIGTSGLGLPDQPLGPTRKEHLEKLGNDLIQKQAEAWSKIYKTPVPPEHFRKGISCLSVDSIALAHEFHHRGAAVVGYELDSTNVHAPMRIAFERGAARQFGGGWINYASGNFGDACNYFTQNPVVPRGAPGWFHSKYAITDGVSATWYRKMYYLNYLSGADAIFWEQGLTNQWMIPGPGKHGVQLSPFGRATEEFQAFVDRLPDRGTPIAPVGILLPAAHGYDRVNYSCKMLGVFPESPADRELRELFNVCWAPSGIVEGLPAAPDVQSLPNGRFGNIFDVLVDRPEKAEIIRHYPVLIVAGDADLSGEWPKRLEGYVRQGGTLVIHGEAARKKLPETLLGFRLSGTFDRATEWTPVGGQSQSTTPYDVDRGELAGATVLATSVQGKPILLRHAVGDGAVILSLIPRNLGLDERAHPALAFLMKSLTRDLLPITITTPDGRPVTDEVLYQVNRTSTGYLLLLMNNRGVDKTPSGVARVDRRQAVKLVVRHRVPMKQVREWTQPRELPLDPQGSVPIQVEPGDVQVIELTPR